MFGIVTLLDTHHDATVEALWDKLSLECGLAGIQLTPIPHFSWQIAVSYDKERLKPVLEAIAQVSLPFSVRTTGLGLFTGEHPVVFIPVVKDEKLLHFHKLVWEMTENLASGISLLYSPHNWMPHITLAQGGVDRDRLICAMERLSFQNFTWEIPVDNIALISQAEEQVGEHNLFYRFSL